MTYPPGQPGPWQGQGSQPPPQPGYPYAPAPYPPQPSSSSGVAVAAMVLCGLACACVVWSVISLIVGEPFVVSYSFGLPAWATALNVGWSIGDILLIVGTILMWGRHTAGRILAVAGLCLVLITVVSFELVAVSTPDNLLVRPQTWLIDVFVVLSLAFVLLPGTSEYLRAGRRPLR